MTSRLATLLGLVLLAASLAHAQRVTTDNDASCDIADLPAATLLLPYFEVDLISPAGIGETTIFTVTNTSQLPQVARVTLWTDLAYPVFSFNIYLTGYDIQSINLYDVLVRGEVAPDAGTGSIVSPVGNLSGTSATREYDNPLLDERHCEAVGVDLSTALVIRLRQAFTLGRIAAAGSAPACTTAGNPHHNAVGYATIDVVGSCNPSIPTDASYFPHEIRFDNVLLGDYMQINGDEDFAQGDTMVHIRAIPEGGHPRDRLNDPALRVPFSRTFYDRFLHPSRKGLDARQPLPSVFAARWIDGGATGFETSFKIWREPHDTGESCRAYANNNAMEFVEIVRFDEEENPTVNECRYVGVPCIDSPRYLPSVALVDVHREEYRTLPANPDQAVAGWMYFNLSEPDQRDPSQAWIEVSMRAEDRFSVDFTAQALGNGCSLAQSVTSEALNPIGPLPNTKD